MAAAGAKTLGAIEQGQQVILQKVLSPTVSDGSLLCSGKTYAR